VTPAAPARSRLPRAERERQVLETAHALFAERGYAAVTMDEVAAEVGVTKPLLYTYFGNKERLFLACIEPAGDALAATVVAAVSEARSASEAVEACADAELRPVLDRLCSLYALHRIEAERGYYQEHGRLTPARSKAVIRTVNALCAELRPAAGLLVEAFGVPAMTAAPAVPP